ncbi:MAG: hypothetical protein NDJ94_21925 [Vicinamibacteria bacterium]|nr:hypothetical protein [Vicinamibacteria bacterium]
MTAGRARAAVALLLVAHAALFLLLFQRQFSTAESQRIRAGQANASLAAHLASVLRNHGPLGLVTALWNGNREVELHRRHARLALGRERDAAGRPLRPYADVAIEYPPLALAVVAVPALVADDPAGYRFWLAAWFGTLVLVNLELALRLALGAAPSATQRARGLAYSLAFLLLFGDLAASRFDHVVPTFLLLGAAALLHAERAEGRAAWASCAAAGGVAAIGACAKFLPLLLLPAALRHVATGPHADKRARAAAVVAGAVVTLTALAALFTAWLGPGATLGVLDYHRARGVEIESTWATLLGVLHFAGLPLSVERSFGAFHLVTSLTPGVKAAAGLTFFALAGLVLWRPQAASDRHGALLGSIGALLLAFLVSTTVLSPQFLLWLLPLAAAAFVAAPRFAGPTRLLLAAALLTQCVYPQAFDALLRLEPAALALLFARNALLAGLLVAWLRAAAPTTAQR